MTFDRWDIVLSLFPFTDRLVAKARPALVLSPATFHREHGSVIVAMITTAKAGLLASDHALLDLGPTGLRHDCVIRWKIMTLAESVFSRRIGEASQDDKTILPQKLATILPIGPHS